MERIEVEITGLGHEGEGVGRAAGIVTFVAGALPGETALAEVVERKKSFQRCRLVKVLRPSAQRATPPCSVFAECGGCQVQHMSYEDTLEWKRLRVDDTLQRIGKLEGVKVNPVLGMENPWRYRNKVQLQAGILDGKTVLGYYSHKTRRLVRFSDCLLVPPLFNQLRDFLEGFLARHIKPGKLEHVVLRYSPVSGEVMAGFVGDLPDAPWGEIPRDFAQVKSVVIADPKSGRVRVGAGSSEIRDQIYGRDFTLSFHSFVQVNPAQTWVLYQKALEHAGLTGAERVVDAYCGIGTITLALAGAAKEVIGVEVSEQAVQDARENARLNRVENAVFYASPAEEILPRLAAEGQRASVVVVDPPRRGCEEEALRAIVEMGPERIVYVSCDPATLARDLARLQPEGYWPSEVQPMDMFPWTAHVESIIMMTYSGQKGK